MELILLSLLAPVLEKNIWATICSKLASTDASETMGGICRVDIPIDAQVALYDSCEGPGEHVYLNMPYMTTEAEILNSSIDALRIVPLPWQIVGSIPFRFSEHINVLEARALLSYIRLCVREGRVSERLLVIIDSGVVKGSLRKFRSSSRSLNFVLRQLAGVRFVFRSALGANVGQPRGRPFSQCLVGILAVKGICCCKSCWRSRAGYARIQS